MGMDQKIEKKKWTPQKLLLYGGGIAAIVFLLFSIYQESGTSKLVVNEERILLDTVQTDVFKEYISIFGTVEPLKTGLH